MHNPTYIYNKSVSSSNVTFIAICGGNEVYYAVILLVAQPKFH